MREQQDIFLETQARALQGNAMAQIALGRMFAMGPPHAPCQDLDEAERWILLGQENLVSAGVSWNEADDSLELQYIDHDGAVRSVLSGDPALH